MDIYELGHCHGVLNVAFRRGIIFDWMRFKRRCMVENLSIKNNHHFIGRTLWDRAHLRSINPYASYHECNEVLRSAFYQESTVVEKRAAPTIVATWGTSPLRGTHVLLRALALVRKAVPEVKLRLPRGKFKRSRWLRGYWSHLDNLIHQLDLSDVVTLLPGLSAEEYASEIRQAHVSVLASLIENSPNTLCEAMILGTPSITSFVGGIPSLVVDEETALSFPPGEHAVLAEQLIRLLNDSTLAIRISRSAREVARIRHDPKTIAHRTSEIYEEIL